MNLAGHAANKTVKKIDCFQIKEIIWYYFMRDTHILHIMKNKELLVYHAVHINKKIRDKNMEVKI